MQIYLVISYISVEFVGEEIKSHELARINTERIREHLWNLWDFDLARLTHLIHDKFKSCKDERKVGRYEERSS